MTDYLTFWKAEAPVFLRPVAPHELFFTTALRTGADRVKAFCANAPALLLVIGDAGTGKSTLLRWLTSELSTATHEVLLLALLQPQRQPGWLMPRLAELMGLGALATSSLPDLTRATAARLDELIGERRQLVVAVDAAHFAENAGALGEIEALMNLQSLATPCVTFVLAGDQSLVTRTQTTPGLASRVTYCLPLAKLARDETEAYINHRLKLGGVTVPFDPDALDTIQTRSGGVLAAINAHAENCLVEAAWRQSKRITPEAAKVAGQTLVWQAMLTPTSAAAPEAPTEAAVQGSTPSSVPPPPRSTDQSTRETTSIKLGSLFKSGKGP